MKQARRDLPKIIDEKVTPEPDKEESVGREQSKCLLLPQNKISEKRPKSLF